MLQTVVKKNSYQDSINLMLLTNKINSLDGVTKSQIMMGTDANKDIFKNAGLLTPEAEAANPSDMVVVVDSEDPSVLDAVLTKTEEFLSDLSVKKDEPDLKEVTNWDDALQKAEGIQTRAGVPTYVVFISDGNPTYYSTGPRYSGDESNGNGQESDTRNVETSWSYAKNTADSFLNGKEGWSFYSVAAFNTQIFHMSANENGLAYHVYNGAVPDGHVYNAQQADDFTNAIILPQWLHL